MIVGAILQATAYSRAQLIVGRIVSGIGMGFINSTTPVFQSEFSPQGSRGVCTSFPLTYGPLCTYAEEISRLHANLHTQLRHHARLLDRFRLRQHPHQRCLARSYHPAMLLSVSAASAPAFGP